MSYTKAGCALSRGATTLCSSKVLAAESNARLRLSQRCRNKEVPYYFARKEGTPTFRGHVGLLGSERNARRSWPAVNGVPRQAMGKPSHSIRAANRRIR